MPCVEAGKRLRWALEGGYGAVAEIGSGDAVVSTSWEGAVSKRCSVGTILEEVRQRHTRGETSLAGDLTKETT